MTKTDVQDQLDAVSGFMSSTAYGVLQRNFEIDVKNHELSILLTRPRTVEDVADLNLLHGKREVAIALQTYFEELRDHLKTVLSTMEERSEIVTSTEET